MMSTNMNDIIPESTQESYSLYLKYSQTSVEVERAHAVERERAFRLRILLLEQDLDEIQSELQVSYSKIEDMSIQLRQSEDEMGSASRKEDGARMELRAKSREVEILKVDLPKSLVSFIADADKTELGSLQSVTMDSTKILTEKLSLARELSSLKPELEHYRAQVNSQQSVIAEKLSLQRQVATLQVELENQKRAKKRNINKENGTSQAEAEMQGELERLKAEVSKHHRLKQGGNCEDARKISDLEERVASLDTRLESAREKLKSARQQLKVQEGEMHELREGAVGNRTANVPNRAGDSRKRTFSVANEDTMIGTPGDQPNRRHNRAVAALGEKSMFSVTPFLNRTAGAVQPVTKGLQHVSDPEKLTAAKGNLDLAAAISAQSSGDSDRPLQFAGLDDKVSKSRLGPRTVDLNKEAIEELDEIEPSERIAQDEVPGRDPASKTAPQFIKSKKRILTGGLIRTLFDEDEGDEPRDGQRFGGLKKMTARRTNTLKPKVGGAFGEISPRKKDRKVQAA